MPSRRPASLGAHALTRRNLLRFAALSAGAIAAPGVLAGCGGNTPPSSSSPTGGVTGTAKFLNLADWIGPNTVADFEKAYPGARIQEVAIDYSTAAGPAGQVIRDADAYDMALMDVAGAAQVEAAGLIQPFDYGSMKNYNNITPEFQKAFPLGVPLDTGQIGIGYRTDLVKEKLETWQDFFAAMPRYPGKTILIDYDRDVIGNMLIALGHDSNTQDIALIEQAKTEILKLKPSVQSFRTLDIAKSLLDGSAYLTMGYDSETANAQAKNPKIAWVAPPEGLVAFLEGWVAVKGTQHLSVVQSFTDFQHETNQYKSFLKATGIANVHGLTQPKPMITTKQAQFTDYLGPEATKATAAAWAEIKA